MPAFSSGRAPSARLARSIADGITPPDARLDISPGANPFIGGRVLTPLLLSGCVVKSVSAPPIGSTEVASSFGLALLSAFRLVHTYGLLPALPLPVPPDVFPPPVFEPLFPDLLRFLLFLFVLLFPELLVLLPAPEPDCIESDWPDPLPCPC